MTWNVRPKESIPVCVPICSDQLVLSPQSHCRMQNQVKKCGQCFWNALARTSSEFKELALDALGDGEGSVSLHLGLCLYLIPLRAQERGKE